MPAIGLLVVGVALSVVAGRSQARQVGQQRQLIAEANRRSFELASSEITASVRLALQRYDDLVRAAGAYVVDHPHASNGDLRSWMDLVQAESRHPELVGLGIAVIVPNEDLAAFAVRAEMDPVGPLNAGGRFEVVPPGPRPFYCLLESLWAPTNALVLPAGLDFCTLELGVSMLRARDSGSGALAATNLGGQQLLVVYTPVYAGGAVPDNTSQRQQDFVAAIGTAVDPLQLLGNVGVDHPNLRVELRNTSGDVPLMFTVGSTATMTETSQVDLGGGWVVAVSGPPAADFEANHGGLLLFVTGALTTLLLSVLVYVLGTSRARAVRLVAAKTDELRHQALHDHLTGLPNRALIIDRLEQLSARAKRHAATAAALYIDIDEFKLINDTLGHDGGDELLVALGARLRSVLRDIDTIGRIGGDEFVALIECDDSDSEEPAMVAERILDAVRDPFHLPIRPQTPIRVTASIGMATTAAGDSGPELLRNADFALYEAKAEGKDRLALFDSHNETYLHTRAELEFDLRNALEADQFELAYQLIYSAHDLQAVSAEALLRWQHPRLGCVQPAQFIPLLEHSGRIVEIGRWVLEQSCEQAAQWNRHGHPLGVAVNVAARQLGDANFVGDVADALSRSGLDPHLLSLEITETALMRNPEAIVARLRTLKELGVTISVDDFGTGYASLAYLQRFPADSIKIDRIFIDAVTTTLESRALLRTLIQLGKILGLTTIAEGVETDEQLHALQQEGADFVQGFLLCRPTDDIEVRLDARRTV